MLDENLLLPSFPKFIKVLLPLIILLKIRIIGYIYIYMKLIILLGFVFAPRNALTAEYLFLPNYISNMTKKNRGQFKIEKMFENQSRSSRTKTLRLWMQDGPAAGAGPPDQGVCPA